MPHYFGHTHPCYWSFFRGTIADSEWDEYIDLIRRLASHPEGGVLIAFSKSASTPNAGQRQRLVDFMQRNPESVARIKALAFVMDSAIARGTVTAINWVFRKPFPEKIFAEPREALQWLRTYEPELNVAEVWTSICAAVPHEPVW